AGLEYAVAGHWTYSGIRQRGCHDGKARSRGLNRATLKVKFKSLYQVCVFGKSIFFAHEIGEREVAVCGLLFGKIDRVIKVEAVSTRQPRQGLKIMVEAVSRIHLRLNE